MPCLSEDTVVRLINGQLSAAATAEVERHLDECAGCRSFLAQVGRALGPIGPVPAAPGADEADARDEAEAAARPSPGLLALGVSLGRYIVVDQIGVGGMGVVYAAYDAELDRKVALKLVRARGAQDAGDAEVRARLLREGQALAHLSHPNVIPVYDVGTYDGGVFLAMELVEGSTLAAWLSERPRGWREVVALFRQAGAGLAAAHAAGLVHRDFKPQNVLIGTDGRARVVDFGLARPAAALQREAPGAPLPPDPGTGAGPLTRTGARLGTPAYMAPEQHRGQPADARADQFCFCVALHEALYGERPFEFGGGESATRARVRVAPGGRGVPAWLRRVVQRGLRTRREERYPSMEALLVDLARSPRSRLGKAAAVAVTVALLAAGGLAYRAHLGRQRLLCQGAGAKLAGVWDAERKRLGHAAFVATRAADAEGAWKLVTEQLDAYTASWAAARTEACEATRRGRQTEELRDLRLECLDWRLEEVRALGTLLEDADAGVVGRAASITRRLTPLDGCASTTALVRRPRPPSDPARRAQANAVRAQVSRGRMLYDAVRLREAQTVLRDAAARARAQGHRPVEAEALYWLAMVLSVADAEKKAAESLLWQAVALAEGCGYDELKAKALSDLVYMIGIGKERSPARLDLAATCGQQAAATIERLGGDWYLEARLAYYRGLLATFRGRHGEAQGFFERAVQLFTRVSPPRPERAPVLHMLGVMLAQQGRLAAAAAQLERALAAVENDDAREHPNLAHYLVSLAEVRAAQGRPEEAIALSRRTLALRRQAIQDEDYAAAEALTVVGDSLATMGRQDDALAQHRKALAIAEKTLGPEDPRAALARANVGTALRVKGDLAAALTHHRRALATLERTVEPAHPDLARALHETGETLRAQRQYAEALRPLERALAIRAAAAIGPADLAATRFALAQALAGVNRDAARARALAAQARDGYAHAEGRHDAALAAVDRWLTAQGRAR